MSIALVVTRGFSNGSLVGLIKDVVTRGYNISADVAAEPVGGYELDGIEAKYYEILEPKKAKKKIKIIRKVIRKKRAEQKAQPKAFDSTELQSLQNQYKTLVSLYAQVQQSTIKQEADQALRSKMEAKKQADMLYQQKMEQEEAEDEAAMIEILLKFA